MFCELTKWVDWQKKKKKEKIEKKMKRKKKWMKPWSLSADVGWPEYPRGRSLRALQNERKLPRVQYFNKMITRLLQQHKHNQDAAASALENLECWVDKGKELIDWLRPNSWMVSNESLNLKGTTCTKRPDNNPKESGVNLNNQPTNECLIKWQQILSQFFSNAQMIP